MLSKEIIDRNTNEIRDIREFGIHIYIKLFTYVEQPIYIYIHCTGAESVLSSVALDRNLNDIKEIGKHILRFFFASNSFKF